MSDYLRTSSLTIKEINDYFRNEMKDKVINEIIRIFKDDHNLTIKSLFEKIEWHEMYLIEEMMIPIHISLLNDSLSFITEKYWLDKMVEKNILNPGQAKILESNSALEGYSYNTVAQLIKTTNYFIQKYPLYVSKKIMNVSRRTGMFEHIQTFETWTSSNITQKQR